MKRIMVVAALATLAACSQGERDDAEAGDTAAATAEPQATPDAGMMAADGKSPVGTFQITAGDGQKFTEEVKADGTYVQKDKDGKVVETGKWTQKATDSYCFTPDKAGAKEECNKEQVDAKGVWTSVNSEGKTATVVRVAG